MPISGIQAAGPHQREEEKEYQEYFPRHDMDWKAGREKHSRSPQPQACLVGRVALIAVHFPGSGIAPGHLSRHSNAAESVWQG